MRIFEPIFKHQSHHAFDKLNIYDRRTYTLLFFFLLSSDFINHKLVDIIFFSIIFACHIHPNGLRVLNDHPLALFAGLVAAQAADYFDLQHLQGDNIKHLWWSVGLALRLWIISVDSQKFTWNSLIFRIKHKPWTTIYHTLVCRSNRFVVCVHLCVFNCPIRWTNAIECTSTFSARFPFCRNTPTYGSKNVAKRKKICMERNGHNCLCPAINAFIFAKKFVVRSSIPIYNYIWSHFILLNRNPLIASLEFKIRHWK